MPLLEILLLAVGSMFWPLLLLVVVLALQTERPVKILSWFLAGGLLTTIVVGAAIVSAIADSSAVSGERPPADPWVNIVVGSLAVLCALVLQFMRKPPAEAAEPAPAKPESGRSPQRYLGRVVERGAPLSFVAGVVLNILPGFLPFIGMKNIAELDYSTGATIAVIAVFYVIMFTFVEVPLVGFVFAPAWTRDATARFNTWLAANLRRLAVVALGAIGAFEIVRGIVAAVG